MRKIAIAAMLVLAVIFMASVNQIHAAPQDNVGPPSTLLRLDLSCTPNPVLAGPELAWNVVKAGANVDPGYTVALVNNTARPYFDAVSQGIEVILNRDRSTAIVSPAIARSGSSTPRHLLSTGETPNVIDLTAGGAPNENGPSPTVVLDNAAEAGRVWTCTWSRSPGKTVLLC